MKYSFNDRLAGTRWREELLFFYFSRTFNVNFKISDQN